MDSGHDGEDEGPAVVIVNETIGVAGYYVELTDLELKQLTSVGYFIVFVAVHPKKSTQ